MNTALTLSPSFLSANYLKLEDDICELNKIDRLWFHLDVMDGHFVPNLSFGPPIIEHIRKEAKHPLDVHLMVSNIDFHLDLFKNLNVHNITFHIEASSHLDRLIKKAKDLYPSVGVAFNPGTPLSLLPHYLLKELDLVLLMTVNPGFGGQGFITPMLDKFRELSKLKKEFNPSLILQADGGVNDETAPSLIAAGCTNLVTGSYLFKNQPQKYRQTLQKLLPQ